MQQLATLRQVGLVGLLAAMAAGVFVSPATAQTLKRYEFTQPHMGTEFRVVLYGSDKKAATEAATAALNRVGQLNAILSDYDPNSELSKLSQTAGSGQAVTASDELWTVLSASQALAVQTGGAFDVTVGPLSRLWRRARRQGRFPGQDRLDVALKSVGYQHVCLTRIQCGNAVTQTATLKQAGMRLDLGGIAKGYAADQALLELRRRGFPQALIDAGGDVVVGDPPPLRPEDDGKPGWRIDTIKLSKDGPPSRTLILSNAAVATSGDAWQYVEIDGKRYSHLVNPHTGLGLTDHSMVTVIAPTGIAADSLASAASVLGPDRALSLIGSTPDAAAFIVRQPGDTVETYQTPRFLQFVKD